MNIGVRLGLAMALSLTCVAGASASSELAGGEPAARIAQVCLSHQNSAEACQCVAREAGSRFESGTLEVIADVLEVGGSAESVSDAMRQAGATDVAIASLADRLERAQVVIRQACEAPLFE